jgi:hypothetical protein
MRAAPEQYLEKLLLIEPINRYLKQFLLIPVRGLFKPSLVKCSLRICLLKFILSQQFFLTPLPGPQAKAKKCALAFRADK